MAECPKCDESGLAWVKTTNGKNWLKRDLGEGQVSKEWHTCNTEQSKHISKKYCHECQTKVTDNWFCKGCNKIISVVDVH